MATIPLRRAFRLSRLVLHLAVGIALFELCYPLLRRGSRLALRRSWCRHMLRVLGVELRVSGQVPIGSYLVAANHVSWLDAFVIGAHFPCWFIAKAETRSWPLIGRWAERNDTLFLERASARAAYRMNAVIRARLLAQESVVFFPEGTTTDGTCVLPFYPALFQPAVDGGRKVVPLAISYRDESARTAIRVAYVNDDPLWKSLSALLASPQIEATLALGDPLDAGRHTRRELAAHARLAITRLHARHGLFRFDAAARSPPRARRPPQASRPHRKRRARWT